MDTRILTALGVAIGAFWQSPSAENAALRTADGVIEFVANPGDGTVTATDRLNHATLSRSLVCPGPTLGRLTPDEDALMILCTGSRELVFLNTATFDVTARVALSSRPASVTITLDGGHAEIHGASGERLALIEMARQRRVERVDARVRRGDPARKNEVVFLGMIHGEHRTSARYGLDVLRKMVVAIDPDYWLTEIPPNRLARAATEFALQGSVAEPRVSRFPEYVDVLFPLSRQMRFTAYGTAGWTYPMDRYRRDRLAAIEKDPSRASDWRDYQAALAESQRQLSKGGASDDPRWIHTDAYDAAQRIQLDVYNASFDAELGTGGWDTINKAHFENISRILDRHRGEGARILITYGAGHKSWMLPRLRTRDDLVVLDPGPFLDRAGVPARP